MLVHVFRYIVTLSTHNKNIEATSGVIIFQFQLTLQLAYSFHMTTPVPSTARHNVENFFMQT